MNQPKTFEKELEDLINTYGRERGSNTPDFILAKYLESCLLTYNEAVKARDKWFGVDMWSRLDESLKDS
jgi:hypothetical protein